MIIVVTMPQDVEFCNDVLVVSTVISDDRQVNFFDFSTLQHWLRGILQ